MKNKRPNDMSDMLVRQLIREYLTDWDQYERVPGVSKSSYVRSLSGSSSGLFGGKPFPEMRKSWFQKLKDKIQASSKTGKVASAAGAAGSTAAKVGAAGSTAAKVGTAATVLRLVAPFLGLPGRILLGAASIWGLSELYTSLSTDEAEGRKIKSIETSNQELSRAGDQLLSTIEAATSSILNLNNWPNDKDDVQKNVDALKSEFQLQSRRLNDGFANNQMPTVMSSMGISLSYPPVEGVEPDDVKGCIDSIALIGMSSKMLIDVNNAIDMLKGKYGDSTSTRVIESFEDEYRQIFLDSLTNPEAKEVIKQSEILSN